MIAGYLYDHVKSNNIRIKKSKLITAGWVCSLFAIVSIMLLFYWSIDIPKPSMLIAIFGGLLPILWGVAISISLLGFTTLIGGSFLSQRIFTVMGRLSFAAYMVHMFFARMAFAFLKNELYINTFHMVSYCCF